MTENCFFIPRPLPDLWIDCLKEQKNCSILNEDNPREFEYCQIISNRETKINKMIPKKCTKESSFSPNSLYNTINDKLNEDMSYRFSKEKAIPLIDNISYKNLRNGNKTSLKLRKHFSKISLKNDNICNTKKTTAYPSFIHTKIDNFFSNVDSNQASVLHHPKQRSRPRTALNKYKSKNKQKNSESIHSKIYIKYTDEITVDKFASQSNYSSNLI